jgi:phosphoribosylaminoimidazole-succinocarboxamide synthase
MNIVTKTKIREFPLISRGKVRDIYEIDAETLLIVTTDRISAFDVIMNEPIPYKGVVLNRSPVLDGRVQGLVANLSRPRMFGLSGGPDPHTTARNLDGRSVIVRRQTQCPSNDRPLGNTPALAQGLQNHGFRFAGKNCGRTCGLEMGNPLFSRRSTKADWAQHDEISPSPTRRRAIGEAVGQKSAGSLLAIYSRGRDLAAARWYHHRRHQI